MVRDSAEALGQFVKKPRTDTEKARKNGGGGKMEVEFARQDMDGFSRGFPGY